MIALTHFGFPSNQVLEMNRVALIQTAAWRELMTVKEFPHNEEGHAEYGCQALYASGAKKGQKCNRTTFPFCGTHRNTFLNGNGKFTTEFEEHVERVVEKAVRSRERVRPEENKREVSVAEAQRIRANAARERRERRRRLEEEREEREAQIIRDQAVAAAIARDEAQVVQEPRLPQLAPFLNMFRGIFPGRAEPEVTREEDELYSLLLSSFQSDSSRHLIREEKQDCQVCLEECPRVFVFPCCKTEANKFVVCSKCVKTMQRRNFVKCPNCRKTCYKAPKPQ